MDLLSLLAYSSIMGFSIFLILPIAAVMKLSQRSMIILNSLSIGILIYLLMDIFMGTYTFVNPNFEDGVFNIPYSIIIILGIILSFALFSFYPMISSRRSAPEKMGKASGLAFIMAWGIGLQNLTEGLALGSSIRLGLSALIIPILVGFTVQNVTEGFPIVAPFLHANERVPIKPLAAALFIGGFPTLIGSALSFYISSVAFVVAFNSVALGSILFVTLQMYRANSRLASGAPSAYGNIGIMAGLLIAFMVNLLP